MTVLLTRSYGGAVAGTVQSFSTELENALIAQNLATASTRASTTTGNQTSSSLGGTVAIAAGASSVVVTCPYVDANSHVIANVAQAAADGTLLRVERIVCAAGSFTIFGTANATAATLVDWIVFNSIVSPATV